MLRVKMAALRLAGEKYWYLDSLFDGVAYIADSRSCQAVRIVNGELIGKYISPYFPKDLSAAEIDISGFTEDDADDYDGEICNGTGLSYVRTNLGYRLSSDDHPFTGLAYEFFGAFCVREFGYKDGIAVSEANWHPNGQLLVLYFENELDECYSWYPDGTRESARISLVQMHPDRGAVRLLHISAKFSASGSLSSIAAEGDAEAFDPAIRSHAYFPVRKFFDLSNYTAAERFVFFDDAVPFQFFESMARNNAFQSTIELHLPSKFLGDEYGVELIGNLRQLRKISLSSKDGTEPEVARKLRKRRPDIEVEAPSSRPSIQDADPTQ